MKAKQRLGVHYVDIRDQYYQDRLTPGRSGFVRVAAGLSGSRFKAPFVRANYGLTVERTFFVCVECACRTQVLWYEREARRWRCRKCAGIHYKQFTGDAQKMNRQEWARVRYGGQPNLWSPFPRRRPSQSWGRWTREYLADKRVREELRDYLGRSRQQ